MRAIPCHSESMTSAKGSPTRLHIAGRGCWSNSDHPYANPLTLWTNPLDPVDQPSGPCGPTLWTLWANPLEPVDQPSETCGPTLCTVAAPVPPHELAQRALN